MAVVAVVLLQLVEPGGVGGHPLREAGLQHEGHGVLELVRLELGVAGTLERLAVGAVRQHHVVERAAARLEALRLGVVLAVDQPHELAHHVHVVPGRPEGVLGHQPAVAEHDEVDVGGARRLRRRGQHGEDRRVGMVVEDRPHGRVAAQIVLVGRVVAVPGDDIERRVRELGDPERPAPLDVHARGRVAVLVGGHGRQEIALVRHAVGADRPALRQGEGAAVVLAQVAARGAAQELDPELHAARDDGDLAGLDVDDAELGPQPQLALLRHEQELAVGVVEVLVDHRAGDEVEMRAHAGLRAGIAGRRHGAHAFEEGQPLVRDRDRAPAQGCDRQLHLGCRCGAPQAAIDLLEPAPMGQRRPDAVEPGALVGGPGCGERRARELLSIEPVRAPLRRVATDRQGARQRLGLEAVAEARHVLWRHEALSHQPTTRLARRSSLRSATMTVAFATAFPARL